MPTMASVAMATLSSASSSAPSSSHTFSSPSSLLRQVSLPLLISRVKLESMKEGIPLPSLAHGGASIHLVLSRHECNRVVTHAATEGVTEEPSVKAEEGASTTKLSKLKLESDLLKKKAKRAELRRKRLVRKRHMRKKGRWPPSKMAKLKNV